jgi:site-specific recombinase XerD
VDISALLGHVNLATTQIDTNVGQARMEQGVARW